MAEISQEELKRMLEKAERELQEKLAKMSPEERAAAELKAKQLIEKDAADMRKLMEDAAAVAAGVQPKETKAPEFCPNCGAPVEGGKFCAYGGSPLTPAN